MKRLVAYDISDDRIRRKTSRLLLRHGIRLQESVFLLDMSHYEYKKLKRQLQSLILDKGVCHMFPLCRACMGHAVALNKKSDFVIIF